jgi:sugar phosphate permease
MYGPGVLLYLSLFCPREKLCSRIGMFVSGVALANAYDGALAYGIAQAKASIGPWRISFIVDSVQTCLIAVPAWYVIVDSPANAYFTKGRDQEIAIELSLMQHGGRQTTGRRWEQVIGALPDYRSNRHPS